MLFAIFEREVGHKIREWIQSDDSRHSNVLLFLESRKLDESQAVPTRVYRPICRLLNVDHGGLAVISEFGDRLVYELDVENAIDAVVKAAIVSEAKEVVISPQEIPPLGNQIHRAFMIHLHRATNVFQEKDGYI
jgi:hypothetical protein